MLYHTRMTETNISMDYWNHSKGDKSFGNEEIRRDEELIGACRNRRLIPAALTKESNKQLFNALYEATIRVTGHEGHYDGIIMICFECFSLVVIISTCSNSLHQLLFHPHVGFMQDYFSRPKVCVCRLHGRISWGPSITDLSLLSTSRTVWIPED